MENKKKQEYIQDSAQKSTQKDPDNESVHVFSAEYEDRKQRILLGIKDYENTKDSETIKGQTGLKKEYGQFRRFARVAAILIFAVILIPVSIHAAVTIYKFTVSQDGHTATGTIQVNKDGASQGKVSEDFGTMGDDAEEKTDVEKEKTVEKYDSADEYSVVGSDGYSYSINPAGRYVEINFSYLPAGMIRFEADKYDNGDPDMGISVAVSQWDGESYDVVNRDIENARTLKAGEYECLLFERGGVDYSFNKLVYIPIKEKSIIITIYAGRAITDEDLDKVIEGMSVNEAIGEDPSKWTFVGEFVYDDSGITDDTTASATLKEDTFSCVDLKEQFFRSGYKMTVNDIEINDNIGDIPERDIVYWFGGLDSSLVDANGKFKTFKCRRLVETSDDEFADWGDYNDSSLRLVTVDMTYERDVSYSKDGGVDTLSFYLDRGEIGESNELQPPVTTNYFYSGENVSAQNSRSVTFASPVYAEIDGQKADLVDVGITMNRDGEKHDLKVYFLVDESEIEDSYMSISNDDGYSQKYDYISVYLGEGK